MEPRLIQQQSQKLILSPQIRQYLRLLQLPMTDLQQAVEMELSENPILEETASTSSEESSGSADAPSAEVVDTDSELRLGESFDKLSELDDNFQESYQRNDTSQGDLKEIQRKKSFQENSITKTETLSEFLLWQTRFTDLSDDQKVIAEEIIGNIDDRGYLKSPLEEIASTVNVSLEKVQKVLTIIQTFDPAGIGARNLQETLTIQLQRKGFGEHLAYRMVHEQLPLLEKRDWKQLARVFSVDLSEIQLAAKIITGMEPYPGRSFRSDESLVIIPDAVVFYTDDESRELKIEIHDELIPNLRISRYYRKLLQTKATDPKTKAFIREKLQAALNFIRALNLRKSTIRQITEELIKAQPGFFEKGFSHLKPLRLKDISEKLNIHESTVSRALQGKYVRTPQGVVPYKSFFSSKLETVSGEAESQKSMMQRIRQMVDAESPEKPLSDQAIVKQLTTEGVKIARRTVAKYRDILKILPSHLRRKR